MKKVLLLVTTLLFATHLFSKELPIADGTYQFIHKFSEQPNIPSIKLEAVISKGTLTMTNRDKEGIFPLGIIESGELYFHELSGEWIILDAPEDKKASEVGACTNGPSAVDLLNRIYWTC